MDASLKRIVATNTTYRAWNNMKIRCRESHKKKNKCYAGVTICPEWADYEVFLRDMGPCPPGLTLDRKEASLGYSKENCRWATWREQNRHRSNNIYIDGVLLIDILEKAGSPINYSTFYGRVVLHGWPVKLALTTPVRKQHKKEQLRNDLHHSVVGCVAGAI